MLHSTKSTNFSCLYIISSLLSKWLREPDELVSRAVVWRPWPRASHQLNTALIVPQSLQLPLQPKPFTPSQSKVVWTKDRDDNVPPHTSKHYWSSSSRFILTLHSISDKTGPAWNHCKYWRLAESFFYCRSIRSNAQRHAALEFLHINQKPFSIRLSVPLPN